MRKGLYVSGVIGLGALLGAGCVGGVKVDPAEPMKDELIIIMYKVDGEKFQDYIRDSKEIEGPVKGIKGIESLLQGLENAPDNKEDKPPKFHPWIR